MTLCILAAGKVTALAVSAFTLSWTHSVEKTTWQEAWRLTPQGFVAESARVEGSGAGMEPPAGAVLDGGGYRYTPSLPPQSRLVLAASGMAGAWRLCAGGECFDLGGSGAAPIVVEACR
jgi:hypothetical protein